MRGKPGIVFSQFKGPDYGLFSLEYYLVLTRQCGRLSPRLKFMGKKMDKKEKAKLRINSNYLLKEFLSICENQIEYNLQHNKHLKKLMGDAINGKMDIFLRHKK